MHRLFRVPYYALSFALIVLLAESIAVNVTVKVLPSAEMANCNETPVGLAEAIPQVPPLRVTIVLTVVVSIATAADACSREIIKSTE